MFLLNLSHACVTCIDVAIFMLLLCFIMLFSHFCFLPCFVVFCSFIYSNYFFLPLISFTCDKNFLNSPVVLRSSHVVSTPPPYPHTAND